MHLGTWYWQLLCQMSNDVALQDRSAQKFCPLGSPEKSLAPKIV